MPKGNMEMVTPTHTHEWVADSKSAFVFHENMCESESLSLSSDKIILKMKFILAPFSSVVREIRGFLASAQSSVLDHQLVVT